MDFLNDFVTSIECKDIRFPTSLNAHGSDAMHTDPDYSCAYVTLTTSTGKKGNGLTFTCGRGTEIIVHAVKSLSSLVINKHLKDIFPKFGTFWRSLTSESQLRWVGPEKGVIHLASAAILNALWDLWAKLEDKPLWKLLADMRPVDIIELLDFRYVTDVLTKDEALNILIRGQQGKEERLCDLKLNGYTAYTTQVGWLGFSDDKTVELCKKYLKLGFTAFKLKVGTNLENDISRLQLVRDVIGWDNILMVDANQVWDVQEAIDWMKALQQFKLLWIEEPTSPDDILGHATIAKELNPLGIGVATGEMCCNRVMFKQFMQANAIQFCQIDAARIGGVNELIIVYLMAKKLGVKVCPHAGGIGLCEMVQHLQMWDYLSVSGSAEGRFIEFVDEHHDYFETQMKVESGNYMLPMESGYSTTFQQKYVDMFEYPVGTEWGNLFKNKLFINPKI